MKNDRRGIRITPKEFEEFRVRIDLDELTFEGHLGNVSDTGLCVIMNDDSLLDELGTELTGAILSKRSLDILDFQGKIVWTRPHNSEKSQFLSGIEFNDTIVLNNQLLLTSMTVED